MIGVDFRDPSAIEYLRALVVRSLERVRHFRTNMLIIGTFVTFVGFETLRLSYALSDVSHQERQRNALALDVQRMQKQVKLVSDRRTAVMNALARRRSNLDLAVRIAKTSDLLGSSMALTQLRFAPEGLVIDGRGTSLAEIRGSLGRIESTFDRPVAFELRRDEAVKSALSFHFVVGLK